MRSPLASIVLAAGKGKRMRSRLPKVLHRLCGVPLLEYAIAKTESLGCDPRVVVVGYGRERVCASFEGRGIVWAVQEEQLGTGHAARTGLDAIPDFQGDVLILNGDLPHLREETLRGLVEAHRGTGADGTVLTCISSNPTGYGRILRDDRGRVSAVVEEPDADPETRRISEINVGVYVYKASVLRGILARLRPENAQGEYYLTDAIVLLVRGGGRGETYCGAKDDEIGQVNDRRELAIAERRIRREILDELMASGVTIVDPDTTYVERGVAIGRDTVILPCTYIERGVAIGEGCEVGPFAHLRPGTVLRDGAEIGNFTEVKNSVVGEGTKAKHLSYLGDAEIGRDVNVGAGTIVANYDGRRKSKTIIEDRAFIGSGSILVAPVKIGDGAVTGAGAVVLKRRDVPPGETVVGVPARRLERRGERETDSGAGR